MRWLVVSNHGGRQLDGAVATFDALPAVVAAVHGRIPVLLDGGVRRGGDVLKALALGAQGVLLGRATLFGTACVGVAGASRALSILKDELIRTMQLCGARSTEEIDAKLLFNPAQYLERPDQLVKVRSRLVEVVAEYFCRTLLAPE